jgi:hypothetical protein
MTSRERAHACAMQAREAFDVVREDEFQAFEDALTAEFEAVEERAQARGAELAKALYEAAAYARGREEVIAVIRAHEECLYDANCGALLALARREEKP